MSEAQIPLGFAGNKALKLQGDTLSNTIQQATAAYKRHFRPEPNICFVPQPEFNAALEDPELAEVCSQIKIEPVGIDALGGPYAWAGRV